jgi:hypothetical protein
VLEEEYNAAKQKYEESKDITYLTKMHELTPKIDNLHKMALEREREETKKSENDRVSQINRKTLEKQKLNDLNNYSLLNRKKFREGETIMHKRKDCKPMNLFDAGYMKVDEENIKKTGDDGQVSQREFGDSKGDVLEHNKFTMKLISDKFKQYSGEIDEIVKIKKERTKKKKDDEYLFEIININPDEFSTIIETHNLKLKSMKNAKIISLNDINY